MSLPFADDVALLASLVRDLQQSMGWFETEYEVALKDSLLEYGESPSSGRE